MPTDAFSGQGLLLGVSWPQGIVSQSAHGRIPPKVGNGAPDTRTRLTYILSIPFKKAGTAEDIF